MSGLTQILNIGITGLDAASQGMQTVSNNTANVNTPGYNLETVNQVSLPGTEMTNGGIGAGTEVTSIQRAFNQFVFQEIVGATASNQAAQTIVTNAQDLASIFPIASGGANGLGQAISSFFGGVNTVAQDPANLPNRSILLGDAQSVASLFNSVGNALAANLASQNQQIGATVQQINTLTSQIAALNNTITAQTAADGSAPNTLLDQRDQLVQELAQDVGINVVQGGNGALDIYATGGAALVNNGSAYRLNAASGSFLDGNVAITYGPTGQNITSSLGGGQLGGLIAFRGQLLTVANSIGALAANFADAINGRQAQGLDLNGNLGQAMFAESGPAVYASSANTGSGSLNATIASAGALVPDNFVVTRTVTGYQATDETTGQVTQLGAAPSFSYNGLSLSVSGAMNVGDSFEVEPTLDAAQNLAVVMSNPRLVAAASPYVVTAGTASSGGSITDDNAGTVQATVGGAVASGSLAAGTVIVPASYFGQELSIEFTSATTFNVLSSGGATIASGGFNPGAGAEIALPYPNGAAAGEAVTITLSPGTPAAGDSFVLTPGGAGSSGNIAAMAALNTANVIANQSLGDYYSQIVSSIGNQGQEAQVSSQAAQAVLTSAQNLQQSISGVNLDDEAALLVSYQQAYQASAQVIATAQSLFAGLITAMQSG